VFGNRLVQLLSTEVILPLAARKSAGDANVGIDFGDSSRRICTLPPPNKREAGAMPACCVVQGNEPMLALRAWFFLSIER
jgi:hypothetical protein